MGVVLPAGEMFRRVPFDAFGVDVILWGFFILNLHQVLHITLREKPPDNEMPFGSPSGLPNEVTQMS
jgi:hypothetical protein